MEIKKWDIYRKMRNNIDRTVNHRLEFRTILARLQMDGEKLHHPQTMAEKEEVNA